MPIVYFSPIIFFFIAFLFSMLGMGGSQLYIPILFWLGMDFKTQAIPLGMLLNVVNSSSAAFTYIRKNMVEWKVALPFGMFMVIFAPIGAWVNVRLPTKPVILIFALFTATAAILMLSGWKPKRGEISSSGRFILGVFAGSMLGFFAGLIGRGGGSFVVPLLYIAGLDPKTAAATSSVIVTFSGSSSFISHIFTAAKPDWRIWMLCILAVFAGSQIGSRFMATKLRSEAVKMIFGILLLIISAILIIKNVLY
ncbi:MAG: sulfite exporter TauE/SafE family protein [Caldiserica bacterium]|nr:MAG: sulfite exporter TauE/SafE family protein [Caldisericota bacterium]